MEISIARKRRAFNDDEFHPRRKLHRPRRSISGKYPSLRRRLVLRLLLGVLVVHRFLELLDFRSDLWGLVCLVRLAVLVDLLVLVVLVVPHLRLVLGLLVQSLGIERFGLGLLGLPDFLVDLALLGVLVVLVVLVVESRLRDLVGHLVQRRRELLVHLVVLVGRLGKDGKVVE